MARAILVAFSLFTLFLPSVRAQSLAGKSFAIEDGVTLTYGADGTYTFAQAGRWQQQGNQVCVTFSNGNQRCDTLEFQNGIPVTLTNRQGRVFRLTPR